MVAVAIGPLNKARRESKPPAGITCPAAFVPPPKPHVWKVTVSAAVRVKVVSKTSSGELRVPVNERLSADRLVAVAASRHSIQVARLYTKSSRGSD
jgi:hypothetical protein